MGKTGVVTAFLLLLILFAETPSLAKIDYSLGGSTIGRETVISTADGFHGPHSAWFSIKPDDNPNIAKRKDRYARAYLTMKDLMPLDDIDLLSMWIKPEKGDGRLELQLYLDGDGDGKCETTHSEKDVKLSTAKISWSSIGLMPDMWNELDAFDLLFNSDGKGKGNDHKGMSLDDYKEIFHGMKVVKFWIRIYNGAGETAAYIDYIRVGPQLISFEPLETEDIKKAAKSVAAGSKITYTITYGNPFDEPIDLKVVEKYDPLTLFLEAFPIPDAETNNIWTIHQLPPGIYGQIKVTLVTIKPKIDAEIGGTVSGEGYASVHRAFSTERDSYPVTNHVDIFSNKINLTDEVTTIVKHAVGSSLEFSEHGSGSYYSSELLSYTSSRIFMDQDLRTVYTPRTISLPGMELKANTSWSARRLCQNDLKEGLLSERYHEAKMLDLSGSAGTYTTKSWLETRSRFIGMVQFETRWRGSRTIDMFAGNFTVSNRAWGIYENKRKYPDKSWLDCCIVDNPYYEMIEENDDQEYENETELEGNTTTIDDDDVIENSDIYEDLMLERSEDDIEVTGEDGEGKFA
jgi:hypothetical protein